MIPCFSRSFRKVVATDTLSMTASTATPASTARSSRLPNGRAAAALDRETVVTLDVIQDARVEAHEEYRAVPRLREDSRKQRT